MTDPRLSSSAAMPPSNFGGLGLYVEYVDIEQLKLPNRRLRKASLRKEKKLAEAISRDGFLVPMQVDDDYLIVNGQLRYAVARRLGLTRVPVIKISHLSPERLRLWRIFDNEIAQGFEVDEEELALEFQELRIIDPDLDLSASGYSWAEIDRIEGRHAQAKFDAYDELPDFRPERPGILELREMVELGRHRLIRGDATDEAIVRAVVGDRLVRLGIQDAPYNVPASLISTTGKFSNFQMAAGELSPEEFIAFLLRFLEAMKPVLIDGALTYAFMDWRHWGELLAAASAAQLTQLQMLVWAKEPGLGSFYRSAHELIGVFKYGNAPHRNLVELGRYGRNRSNVLYYPSLAGFGRGRAEALDRHPTCKPAALIADLILDASIEGELVLDCFGGSGTTLIAAEATDRTACLIEIDAQYCDVIIERFERMTGQQAVMAATGQPYAQVRAERLPPPAES